MPPERSLQQTRTVKDGQVAAAGTIGLAFSARSRRQSVRRTTRLWRGAVPRRGEMGLLVVTLIGIGVYTCYRLVY
jgi:hypothetical protein